jgi:probable FeS assembly SUF system protein SufT
MPELPLADIPLPLPNPKYQLPNTNYERTMNRERTLSREVTATQIPSGDKQPLPPGTRVLIHQTLGGSYTVQTDFGLFRIDGSDADALGEAVKDTAVKASTLSDGAPDPEAVWAQLRQVFDPEIPVNIVDLGLVYSMDVEKVEDAANGGAGYKVNVAMTLTAPGCGMGPAIAEDAKSKVLLVPGVTDADVRITWDPPWNQQMISEEGKMKLGLI